MGDLEAVTLAGQGEIKAVQISSSGMPVFSDASRLAIRAATSTGALRGSTWLTSWGKRTRMSRVTAGQAEEMTGFLMSPYFMIRRVASLTSSAARETSNTPSKPRRSRAPATMSMSLKLLNWANRAGGGRAILYL